MPNKKMALRLKLNLELNPELKLGLKLGLLRKALSCLAVCLFSASLSSAFVFTTYAKNPPANEDSNKIETESNPITIKP